MKLIANLKGDFLCPFQILLDIASQLPDAHFKLKQSAFLPICDLNNTNDWINLESLGTPEALRARKLTHALLPHLLKAGKALALHVYIPDAKLGSDNLYALLFLAEAFEALHVVFYSAMDELHPLQDTCGALRQKANVTLQYQSCESFFQETSHRSIANHLENERYAVFARMGFHFHRAWMEQEITVQNMQLMIGYAWTCLKAGASAPGCEMLLKGLKIPNLNQEIAEYWFMHLQLIRFLSHQYETVAALPFPERYQYLNDEDIFNLNFVKAYCATISRQMSTAREYFRKAGIHEAMALNTEASLYHLNLYALLQVLEGNIDLAFTLEMRIKEFIENHQIDVAGLKYVNFINIARLYKKTKQYEQSFLYYEKAYSEISGGYTASDNIYYHLNLASLYEAAGEAQGALTHWINAGLHWITMPNQYALAWRPRLILCQETIGDILQPLSPDAVSDYLYQKIKSALCKINANPESLPEVEYHFIADEKGSIKKNVCYGIENMIFYSTDNSLPSHAETKAQLKLRRLISGFLHRFLPDICSFDILVFDTQCENKLLQTDELFWLHAYLADANKCYHNGQELRYTPRHAEYLLEKAQISLVKSICAIKKNEEGLALTGKRSFLNQTIQSADEIEWIMRLAKHKTLSGKQISAAKPVLARLLQKKLILFDFAGGQSKIPAKSSMEVN
ncbi:hypothetical protein [Legionella londiniensis]|uniref:hypothetical protein n=1 Tax=Legionella londiniensis TaxID=45068 RepID=UPI00399D4342